MKKYSFLITFFSILIIFGQDYTGRLETVKQDGIHSLLLTSQIRSATQENFDYLRIKNSHENEVPYVIMYPTDKTFSNFQPLQMVYKNSIKDSVTSIVLKNEFVTNNDHFTLKINNTSNRKNYSIYGSNNQKEWFGLVSNRELTSLSTDNKTFVEKTIYFPLNTYTFLRIDFNDKETSPIDVLEVGVYKNIFFTQEPTEIKNYKQKVIPVKNRKVTQIKFTSENTNKIDLISFKINTKHYLRKAKLIVKKTQKVNRKIKIYDEVIGQFELNSKHKNTFIFDNLNEKEFWIEIENQDNPSLDITMVNLFQKPIYLLTNLEREEKYNLIIDENLREPSYDLGHFISDKTNSIGEISVQNFSKAQINKNENKKKSFWNTPFFMWSCIIFGGAIVLYFAIGLLKDLSNNPD